jgi:hypothetical protein
MKTAAKQKTSGTVNGESKSHKRHIVAASLALFLIVLAARAFRSNPVDQARQLRAQLFSQDEDLSPEERQELGKKLRDQVKELTPEQRRELMSDRQKEMAKEMERFFQLPPAEQQQALDKKIDQMIARMEKGGAGGPGGGPGGRIGGGGPGGFGGGPGAAGANSGQAGDNPGAPGGPGNFAGKGPQQREERRQQRLDDTTPAFRAQMFEYRQMMQNRMQERGLQLPAFGPKRP